MKFANRFPFYMKKALFSGTLWVLFDLGDIILVFIYDK